MKVKELIKRLVDHCDMDAEIEFDIFDEKEDAYFKLEIDNDNSYFLKGGVMITFNSYRR